MTEYKIAKETSMRELEYEVNRLIRLGWIPQGGVALQANRDWIIYAQAMTKKGTEE